MPRVCHGRRSLTLLPDLSSFELVAAALFYQFSLYSAVRLAHHGLTLGELALVCFGATVLFVEAMNLTMSRVRALPTVLERSPEKLCVGSCGP